MPSATLARLVSRCRGLAGAAAAAPDRGTRPPVRPGPRPGRVCRTGFAARRARLGRLPAHPAARGRLRGRVPGHVPGPGEAARSIDPKRPLAGWLHAVAVRVARRGWGGRCDGAYRHSRRIASGRGTWPVTSAARDLYRAVDEEINRLPAVLRAPVILCCLEGRARDEAAEALGCSVPAVKARLERARQALRRALARRGIPLPAALVVLGLGGSASSRR